jgi:pimeloyl-ACP methyl ester carboxylesterase
MQKIKTSYGSIAYDEHGTGQAVVLLHANAGDHHNFDSIVPGLSAQFRTIAFDLPGFGESDACRPPNATTSKYMALAVEAAIDELGLEKAFFIGNSLGGYIAARLAITQPERVSALVLVDTAGFSPQTPFTRFFCQVKGREWVTRLIDTQFAKRYLKRRNQFVKDIINLTDHYRQNPVQVAVNAALWRSFSHPESDLRQLASSIHVPSLLIWGRYDPVVSLAVGELAQAIIPNAQLSVLDTGHMPFAEDPPGFLKIVEPFLQALQSQGEQLHA